METDNTSPSLMQSLLRGLMVPRGNTMLVDRNKALGGDEAIQRINQCRYALRSEHGLRAGNQVVLLGLPQVGLFVWIYAAWCEGLTVIPVDSSYPPAYLQKIAGEASATIDASELPDGLDYDGEHFQWSNEQVAMVLYTSGTTGTPKGIRLSAGAYLSEMNLKQVPRLNTVFWASVSSGIIVYALLAAASGCTVVCVTRDEWLSNSAMHSLSTKWNVSHVFVTPSYASVLMSERQPWLQKDSLQVSLFGEPALPALVKKIGAEDQYGQTEAGAWLARRTGSEWLADVRLGLEIHDEKGLPVTRPDTPGELVVTERKYLALSYTDGRSIVTPYGTGDYAEWISLIPPRFRILGRQDRLVNVRGYRVELDGIQQSLLQIPGVRNGAIRFKSGIIEAYICADQKNSNQIRKELSKCLPCYMMPTKYEFLDTVPLTDNGKVDWSKLTSAAKFESSLGFHEDDGYSKNETEIQLIKIWEDVLQVQHISTAQNFLELGGDSLAAMKIIVRVSTEFGQELNYRDFFRNPTITDLAARLRGGRMEPSHQ